MSEEMQDLTLPEQQARSVGETLKAAREGKGLSAQDAATRLRLMTRQVEAMEADDFASLGQPVFARGFVRNYARLLGVDEVALLAQMSPITAVPAPQPENLPFAPKPGFWASPWVMSSIGAIILVLAVPVGLYLWLNSGEKPETAPAQPVAPQGVQPAFVQPVTPPAPEAAVSATPETAAEAVTDNAATGAAVPLQVTPALSTPAASTPVTATSAVPTPAAPQTVPVLQAVSAGSAPQSILFRLEEPAWLQVRDGTGKMVHSALNLAGRSVVVKGVPPFTLVVGNAAKVQVTYKNKPVDITPYIDVTVARFTLD